jgi:cytochrome c oxidase assembly protein subunit 15
MLLAFVLIALLVWLYINSGEQQPIIVVPSLKVILVVCMMLLLCQVILGTEVRASIDRVSSLLIPRENWISSVWAEFVIHRSFSWIVIIFNGFLVVRLVKTTGRNPLTVSLILLILLTVLTGVGMAYLAVPAVLQPIHLLLATVTFGVQFLLFLRLKMSQSNF